MGPINQSLITSRVCVFAPILLYSTPNITPSLPGRLPLPNLAHCTT